MSSFLRNTISKLHNAVSAPVAQHEMDLQKDCRAYVKMLLYCITG